MGGRNSESACDSQRFSDFISLLSVTKITAGTGITGVTVNTTESRAHVNPSTPPGGLCGGQL